MRYLVEMDEEEILLMRCLKKIVLLYFFSVASAVQAFDAGTSNPNLSVFDDLPGSTGCRMQATFLAPARNITELILLDFGNNVSHQYGGIYYASQFNAWSADETTYNIVTTPDLRIGGGCAKLHGSGFEKFVWLVVSKYYGFNTTYYIR